MFGSYCKKLFSSFFFLVVYALFVMGVAFLWTQFAAACRNNFGIVFGKTFNYCMSAILTLLIELLAVYFVRIDNLKHQESYLNSHAKETYNLKVDFVETLKCKAHITHTVAFNTWMLLLFLLIGIGKKFGTVLIIVGAIGMSFISVVLFSVISTLMWCIVHKKWLNPKEPIDFKKLWKAIVNRLKGWS